MFVTLLMREGRRRLIDVGAGPGLDAQAFTNSGIDVVGLDLTPAHGAAMAQRRIPAVVASLYQPPFGPGSFDAVWTMSTLVHVPDSRLDEALAAVIGLARAGAPVGIGTWGGFDFEGVHETGDIRPYRFFALRNHDRMRAVLARHASVDRFDVTRPAPDSDWEYQFAVVRGR